MILFHSKRNKNLRAKPRKAQLHFPKLHDQDTLSMKPVTSYIKKKVVSAVQPNGNIKCFASSGFASDSPRSTN